MVCRSEDHLIALGKDHRLENVHDLSDVSHLETVSVTMEDVERHRCNHSVTHCVLLIEVTWVCTWLNVEPCSPLVEEKVDLTLWIVCVHDSLVVLDNLFNLNCL